MSKWFLIHRVGMPVYEIKPFSADRRSLFCTSCYKICFCILELFSSCSYHSCAPIITVSNNTDSKQLKDFTSF